MSRSTVADYVQRAKEAGLSWPLSEVWDDEGLESKLFGNQPEKPVIYPTPNWETIHQELKRKGVTLQLLWREYLAYHPEGYGYSSFTLKYREWKQGINVTLRQDHKAGEKLFVDYAGMTVPIVNPSTGEITEAQVFVAVLGASNYTYVEVTQSQKLEDWLASHRRAFEFFGGVPEIVVPDNLKSGVTSPCYYEPEINWAYAELAQHYDVAVIPTRIRKPRDKAKVETGVKIVEEQILAPLRHRSFFSVRETNEAVAILLTELNHKPFQKLPGSRQSLFEQLEKPVLRPLPVEAYVLATWKKAKVNIDYHIEIDGHYYSAPFQYARQAVDVRLTSNTLEIYHQSKRIASHRRLPDLLQHRGRHSTIKDHMPKAHQENLEWTPSRMINWAQKTGEYTAKVVETILERQSHPEKGFRSCLGILRLAKGYEAGRLEAACRRASYFGSFSYKSVKSILANNLDKEPLPQQETQQLLLIQHHTNIRGAGYYQQIKEHF
jgi:transposase